jgi:hypothetical protein
MIPTFPMVLRWFGLFKIPGLAVVCLVTGIALAGPVLTVEGKAFDWVIFVVVTTGLPLLALGVPLLWKWQRWRPLPAWAAASVPGAVGLTGIGTLLWLCGNVFGWMPLAIGALAAALQTLILEGGRAANDGARPTAAFAIAWAGWALTLTPVLYLVTRRPDTMAGTAVAFALVTGSQAMAWRRPWGGVGWKPGRLAGVVAVVALAFMSLRVDLLFELGPVAGEHHWGAWIGPAELIRQGGWLLWDVPSMYGTLSVATIAAMPTATTWQAFYLLQAAAMAGVGYGVYRLARAISDGWLAWLLGIAAGCALIMSMGRWSTGSPSFPVAVFPNFGPYRYVWCAVLLALVVGERFAQEGGRRQRGLMVLGCAAWTAGVLWSPESAVFCSGAWIPAYGVMGLRAGNGKPGRTLAWLALPVGMLAAVALVMEGTWRRSLGTGPDWVAMLDFVRGLGLVELVRRQTLTGPGVLILLAFVVVVLCAANLAIDGGRPTRSLAMWAGLIGASVALNTYGYQRSYLPHPLVYTMLLGVLAVVSRPAVAQTNWAALVRGAGSPLVIAALTLPLSGVADNPLAIRESAANLMETARRGFEVAWLLPVADDELQELLLTNGVAASTPLAYIAGATGNQMPPWTPEVGGDLVFVNPQWTPLYPAAGLRWVPIGRDTVYATRFLERRPRGGWLIQDKRAPGWSPDYHGRTWGMRPSVLSALMATHVPTTIRQSANWDMTWFELAGPDVVRPVFGFRDGLLAPLPQDVIVDGLALSESPDPEFWAAFGTGWSILSENRPESRIAQDGAVLWIYSPAAMTARLEAPVIRSPKRMEILVNGAETVTADGTVAAEFVVQPGWSAVTFSLKERLPLPGEAQKAEEKPERAKKPGKSTGDPNFDDHSKGRNDQVDLLLTAGTPATSHDQATPVATGMSGPDAAGDAPVAERGWTFEIGAIRIDLE